MLDEGTPAPPGATKTAASTRPPYLIFKRMGGFLDESPSVGDVAGFRIRLSNTEAQCVIPVESSVRQVEPSALVQIF
jgi:hypothetical protein